jgi:hypothetical protein
MDSETVSLILRVVLLCIGLALAFFGKAIWDSMMAFIGGIIGWFIGLGLAIYFLNPQTTMDWVLVIIIAFAFCLVCALLFGYVVEIALAFITAVLIAGLVYYMLMDYGYAYIVAIIVFVIAFAVVYYFIDEILVGVTALIGSILASAAIWLLTGESLLIAVACFFLILIGGILFQIYVLKEGD